MKQIPALLQKREIEFDGLQTKNMAICKEAKKLFESMIHDLYDGKLIAHPELTDRDAQIKSYIENKPESTKKQQFKHYLGL